jgi:hypothetical protein
MSPRAGTAPRGHNNVPLHTTHGYSIKISDLKFTQCNWDQFTCHSYGGCIPLERRCNGINDCLSDLSDEQGCTLVTPTIGYKKQLPPIQNETDLVDVKINLDVIRIYNIRELDFVFSASFKMALIWSDYRLLYSNLHYGELNIVGDKKTIIWSPILTFINTEGNLQTNIDSNTEFIIERKGQPRRNSLEDLDENLVFDGKDNPLNMKRYYSMEFGCVFDLKLFPFDDQLCLIQLGTRFDQTKYVSISFGNVTYKDDLTIPQFQFKGLEIIQTGSEKEIIVLVKMKRIMYYHLATTYLPTTCLITIAEMTLVIHKKHFEATIMVALTSMLVMYTLYQSVSSTLPQTAYLKMIDIWLVAGLVIPFLVFMVLIANDELHNEQVVPVERPKLAKLVKGAKLCIPTLSILFGIVYWIIALYYIFA